MNTYTYIYVYIGLRGGDHGADGEERHTTLWYQTFILNILQYV